MSNKKKTHVGSIKQEMAQHTAGNTDDALREHTVAEHPPHCHGSVHHAHTRDDHGQQVVPGRSNSGDHTADGNHEHRHAHRGATGCGTSLPPTHPSEPHASTGHAHLEHGQDEPGHDAHVHAEHRHDKHEHSESCAHTVAPHAPHETQPSPNELAQDLSSPEQSPHTQSRVTEHGHKEENAALHGGEGQ